MCPINFSGSSERQPLSLVEISIKPSLKKIQKRTQLIPEHIGISSEVFFAGRLPFQPFIRSLEGAVTCKNETLKVRLDNIRVPEGELCNWKLVMSHLKELAKYNNAKTLQFEASFINPKFQRVMEKLYGTPEKEKRMKSGQELEWCIFKIPVE
jgi:hypothetical protein